ncbi:hypothetical protein FACS189418_2070 [Clostridia bacterium]|nr:hypothetical protein FACS189418_2070 [Clostridia bacterium]
MKKSMITTMIALILALSLVACNKKNGGENGVTTSKDLFSLKSEYIGNVSNNEKILQALEIPSLGTYTQELKTDATPYILTINFSKLNVTEEEFNSKMRMYSYVLLALIENVDEIHWNVETADFTESKSLTVADANKIVGNIKNSASSSEELQSLLVAIEYDKIK